MKVYTKIGDEGRTCFFGCGLISKDDPRIEAFGALDELNSVLGVSLCFVQDELLREKLLKIQNDLFQVGADLAGSAMEEKALPRITPGHISEVEESIDEIQDKLGMPKKFILPGGTVGSSFLHLCRAITRRAERDLVRVKKVIDINPDVLIYVNRLSDLLYVLARDANKEVVQEQQPIYKYFAETSKTSDTTDTENI